MFQGLLVATALASLEPAAGDVTPGGARDAKLRTRIAEIRQTLDRLLADAAPSAV